MYRGTWLALSIPLLLAAFSVARPARLEPPDLPAAFDGSAAQALATEMSSFYSDRVPGTPGDTAAAIWFRKQLAPYGFRTESDRFSVKVAGRGRVELENLVAVAPGRSGRTILVTAHRDDTGEGPGANDNASGTAALIALARSYAGSSGPVRPLPHRIVFLSTDGGTLGGLGAAHFLKSSAYSRGLVAVINLDAIAGDAPPRLVLTADEPRSPSGAFVRTAAVEIADESGSEPRRDGFVRQLFDLAFPFSLYEQAPFVSAGVPALTITTAGDVAPTGVTDTPGALNGRRLTQIGRATQDLIGSIEQVGEVPAGPSASYLYLGERLVRGWAIQLVLITALLPFVAAAIDLFARCRRRRIPLAPAFRSYRSRVLFWLFVGGVFWLFAVVGVWPDGTPRPPALDSGAVRDWPLAGLLGVAAIALTGWLVVRERLLPRRHVRDEEVLAGHTAALVALGVVGLLVIATNAYALLFVLPSAHAWLWLPQFRDRSAWARAALLAAGFAGPLLLIGSFALRYGLGVDTPWYLAELLVLGYVPFPAFLIGLAWLACAGQLTALAAGRYAPYPTAAERPPRGPIRETVRRLLLVFMRNRRTPVESERTVEA